MNLGKILVYLKETQDEYTYYCDGLIDDLTTRELVHLSFKYCPSLTYLDLSSCELSSQSRTMTSWENWRKYIDNERKTVIYKLDLEDKNQLTLCSPFCFQNIFPIGQQWELNYEGFPGYIRYHNASVPENYEFKEFQTLSGDIVKHLMKSNDKNALIQRWLPTITRLEELIGLLEVHFIYITFLQTVFPPESPNYGVCKSILGYSAHIQKWLHTYTCLEELIKLSELHSTYITFLQTVLPPESLNYGGWVIHMGYSALIQKLLSIVTRSEELIGLSELQSIYITFLKTVRLVLPLNDHVFKSVLDHFMSSKLWFHVDIFYIEVALTFNEIYQPLNANIFKGSYGLLYHHLWEDGFSELETFIRYGLLPFKENSFDLNKNTEAIEDHFGDFEDFLRSSMPRGFSEYARHMEFYHQLTHNDMNILIVLHLHRKPKEQKFLTLFWRCISNAFLTYQDFKHFFTPELLEEQTKTLNSIYLWYKGIVEADNTVSQPRNLKHYCRYALRRKLKEYWKLPNGIEDLPLPSSLKAYLRLEH